MDATPFDGCVFHVNSDPGEGQRSLTWGGWGRQAFTWRELGGALADLENLPLKSLTQNLLRFNVTPGDVSWFADHSAVIENARLAARLARHGSCLGICFDIEQYNSQLFDYSKLKQADDRPWREYSERVRSIGSDLMQAFQSELPGLTILLTFGYSLPWHQMANKGKELAGVSYGLLVPLLDGMVEAARQGSKIVDGYELAYSYKDTSKFEEGYRMMSQQVLEIVADPEKYRRTFSFGFGLWMDCDWRKRGWHVEDFEKNFYTPAEFEASLSKALEVSDEYVWIYTETPRWWSAAGGSIQLPGEYVDAVRGAMEQYRK